MLTGKERAGFQTCPYYFAGMLYCPILLHLLFVSIAANYHLSAMQKLTTEHTEYTEPVRFMNNKDNF